MMANRPKTLLKRNLNKPIRRSKIRYGEFFVKNSKFRIFSIDIYILK